jgi:iron-sulfur cluster assembly accessory protein
MIHVTPTALTEIRRLARMQGQASPAVRLQLINGGCLEKSYDLVWSAEAQPGDRPLQIDDIQLRFSTADAPLLRDLCLDYVEDLSGGSFRFENPQIQRVCDCGQSFSLQGLDYEI